MPSGSEFLALTAYCTLKHLEELYLYDIENDELYELSPEAYQFLLQTCQGENPSFREEDKEFIQFCLDEHLIKFFDTPRRNKVSPHPSPVPSLRYLELQITDRCDLRCHHCYIGDGLSQDLPVKKIEKVLEDFEEMQGLRLLLSGGEPVLHPKFWEINERLRDYAFRSVLLSNGILMTRDVARRLRVHEVQISLDGMQPGHESIRGKGTFRKTLAAIDHLQEAHIRVSVATMIHGKNLKEFDQMKDLLESKNIQEWNVDVPCMEGRLRENSDLWVTPSVAGPFLNYGFGGGLHSSGTEGTCGIHLCAVLPNENVCKCGLFSQEPVGSIDEGLRMCWERIPRGQTKDLTCACPDVILCKGGCRYRARAYGGVNAPDPFQCAARGFLKGGEEDEYQEGR